MAGHVCVAELCFGMTLGFRGRGGGGGPSFDMKGGDWPCPNRCVASSLSRVVFLFFLAFYSSGVITSDIVDYPCSSCGNINFARRHECNKCGAPKPGDAGFGSGGERRPCSTAGVLQECKSTNCSKKE